MTGAGDETAGKGRAGGARLTIGALSRATDIPVETLRTWERRYGYPRPERKPSGHRLYAAATIPRLRRIAEVLARGHRPAEVVSAPDTVLTGLLDSTARPVREQADVRTELAPEELLDAVERFQAETLTGALLADWARLGPLPFLERRVAPLLRAVGTAWEQGRLDVSHEHFVSERVGDLLRSVRLPSEERALGPLVVLATLPGERHGLGLQMAALVLAVAGCRVLHLGTEVPLREIATLARDILARAVGISVSSATGGRSTVRHLATLRTLLPRRITLLVGGEGSAGVGTGMTRLHELRALDDWSRRVAAL